MGQDKAFDNRWCSLQLVCDICDLCNPDLCCSYLARTYETFTSSCRVLSRIASAVSENFKRCHLVVHQSYFAPPPRTASWVCPGLAQVKQIGYCCWLAICPDYRFEVLQGWAAGLDSVGKQSQLFHTTSRLEPLCGFYRRSCFTSNEQYINQGGRCHLTLASSTSHYCHRYQILNAFQL